VQIHIPPTSQAKLRPPKNWEKKVTAWEVLCPASRVAPQDA